MWERIQETEKFFIFFSLPKRDSERSWVKPKKPVHRWKWAECVQLLSCVLSFSHVCSVSLMCAQNSHIYSASFLCAQHLSCVFSISHVCSASLACIQHLSYTLSIFHVFSISHVCSASFMPLQWVSSNCTVPTHLLTCTKENVIPTVTCPQRFRGGRWSPGSRKGLPHASYRSSLIVGSKVQELRTDGFTSLGALCRVLIPKVLVANGDVPLPSTVRSQTPWSWIFKQPSSSHL